MFAEIFIMFYAGHLAADYPGQTDHQAKHKADKTLTGWIANATHAGTHVAVCGVLLVLGALVLDDVALQPLPAALALAWIGATHSFIDRRWPVRWWMENTGQSEFMKHGGAQHVDQAAHVIALLVAALFLAAV
ncbi:DUF3307 domain-containing protein [Streptomyces harbinensis]|uniref:DUF3307 domain-containing protein n=1 Tax=Streptomyces harbinensis TaxID=1176198 RepID=UPI00368BE38F